MGLLSAATGGLAMDFKDGIEAVEGLGISMKGLRGAIIATGIGALAILVLELVTNWEKWSDVIDGSKSKLEAVNKELDVTRQRYEDLQYAGDLAIEIMELEGKSLEEIAKQRRANFEEQRENLIQQLELEKKALSERIASYVKWSTLTKGLIGDQEKLQEAVAKVADIEDQIKKLSDKNYVDELKTNNARNAERQKSIDEANKKREEANKKAAEANKKAEAERQAELKAEIELALKRQKSLLDIQKNAQDELNKLASTKPKVLEGNALPEEIVDTDLIRADKFQAVIDNENVWYGTRLKAFENYNQLIKDSTTLTEEEKANILQESAEKQIDIEKQRRDFITNSISEAGENILNIVSLFGDKNKKLGKKIAIGQIIVEQAKSASLAISNLIAANGKAVSASPLTFGQPWVTVNTLSTSLGIASSIASATKAISAINSDSQSVGGGGSSVSAGGGGGSAPQAQFNIVGTSSTNQLASTIATQQNQPVQAFVVGSDISTQSELDRKKQETATFL
jgi:hypothetical protein